MKEMQDYQEVEDKPLWKKIINKRNIIIFSIFAASVTTILLLTFLTRFYDLQNNFYFISV